MVTRIISANASEILKMDGTQLKQSIKASEGRTVLSENVVTEPAIDNLTTSEIAAAFGADLILLNLFDTLNPKVSGLEVDKPEEICNLVDSISAFSSTGSKFTPIGHPVNF